MKPASIQAPMAISTTQNENGGKKKIGRHNWATATRSKKSRSELTKALDLAAVKQK
jgi:hypothetical protein